MERSPRCTVMYPWFLAPVLLVSLAALTYPVYVIRPFRTQGPHELAAALAILQIRPPIELACALCALGGLLWYWRTHPRREERSVAAAGAFLVCAFAILSRMNIYELMFHPDAHPLFASVQQVKLDPDDKVLAVKLGGSARAYPIRSIAYHHIINDVVGRDVMSQVPIVATY
jgi:hypothetical protein